MKILKEKKVVVDIKEKVKINTIEKFKTYIFKIKVIIKVEI